MDKLENNISTKWILVYKKCVWLRFKTDQEKKIKNSFERQDFFHFLRYQIKQTHSNQIMVSHEIRSKILHYIILFLYSSTTKVTLSSSAQITIMYLQGSLTIVICSAVFL